MSDNLPEIVDLDLDTVERPASTKPVNGKVFAFNLKGRRIEMSNPHELDLLTVSTIESPVHFIRELCSTEDREFIRDNVPELWKFRKLVDDMLKHYKFDKSNLSAGDDF